MKKILLYILLLFLPQVISAQSIRGQVAQKAKVVIPKSLPLIKTKKASKPIKAEIDTIYCLSTKRQHGWIDGLDIVSKEDAKHNFRYFMLTNRNSDGHWTKMQVLNGYGNYVEGQGESPYILSIKNGETDVNANRDWVRRLKTVCQYEFIEDPIMGTFVQERAYDKNMTLVYTFSRMRIGNNKYLGTYKDSYGLPAEMRVDSAYTYGTLAVITEDIWGNDSIVEFVDSKGIPKNNNDGVGMEVQVGDKYGHIIKQMSCDHDGNLVIDNWGHCGAENTYDMKTHRKKTQMTMDNHWQPMPTPFLREDDGIRGCVKIEYFYDKFGRDTAINVITPQDEPTVNVYGTHRFVRKYDNYGNRIISAGYDLKGNLSPLDGSGVALCKTEYDDLGRDTFGENFDKDRNPLSTLDRISRYKCVYGDDGLLDEQVYWAIKDGEEDTCYYYKRTINSYYERYNDGSFKIDSIDKKGRYIMTAYYNADGSPKYDNENNYHREQIQYIDNGPLTWEITKHFDVDGELYGKYPFNKSLVDSLNFTRLTYLFDSNERLIGAYLNEKDSDFYYPLSQVDVNKYGNICRAGGNARHYRAKVLYTQKGEFASFVGRDEFDEPDYIWTDDGTIFYYGIFRKGNSISYDENNNPIRDYSEFRNRCPKAMSIEVIDSTAYKLGLKDNDIILCYGDSYQINDSLDYLSFIGEWSVAQILEATKEKNILVFRIDSQKKCDILSLNMPKGNPSELGFIAHPIFRTQKQRMRLWKSIEAYRNKCIKNNEQCLWREKENISLTAKKIIVAFPEMYMPYRQYPYPQKIKDPSILLSYQIPDFNKRWTLGDNSKILWSILNFRRNLSNSPKISLHYLKKGFNLEQQEFTENTIWCRFFDYEISETTYKDLELLVKDIEPRMNTNRPHVKSNQLKGKWQTVVIQNNLTAILELTLSKDGSYNINVTAKMEGEIKDSVFLKLPFVVTVNNGKWGVNASILSLNYSKAISDCSISKIEIEGLEGEEKETKINEIQTLFEQNKSELISNVEISKLLGSSELIIQDVGKTELKVTDGTNIITFKKIK